MARFLRLIIGIVFYIKQHFSLRAFLSEGKFLILNLSNADSTNQDMRQRLGQLLTPGLDLVHFSIGRMEVNNKWNWLRSKLVPLPGFPNQGLELSMEDVQLLVRRSRTRTTDHATEHWSSASSSGVALTRNNETEATQQQQKPFDWLNSYRKVPELVKRIEVQRLHLCFEDETDPSRPLLAGLAFTRLQCDGEKRSIELISLTMHLSPPLSSLQPQHEELKSAMSEIFTGNKQLRFHPVLHPLTMSLQVNLSETASKPKGLLHLTLRNFNFEMSNRQYDLLTGQVDRLNRLFRRDFRQATASEADYSYGHRAGGPGSDAVASGNAAASSTGPVVQDFNAKILLDADQICFALWDRRSAILNVQFKGILASLKRVDNKYSLKASLASVSATGYDGRQLVATEACRCSHPETAGSTSKKLKFIKLCRPANSPCSLEIGACRIVHCVSTATHLTDFFRVPSSTSLDPADNVEPELDEDLLRTLRYLTRRGGNGSQGSDRQDLRFRGHLDQLSFHLPAGSIEDSSELVCLFDEVDLLWLKAGRFRTGARAGNLIDEHLNQLCLTPDNAPTSVHQLRFRWQIVAYCGGFIDSGSGLGDDGEEMAEALPLADSRIACELGVNSAMDLPKLSLVVKATEQVLLRLSPASLATVAGAARWSGPSLSRLLGIPSALPNFAQQQQQQQENIVESPLKWQAYITVDDLKIVMATTQLQARFKRLRLNAVKQPNWFEARLILEFLLLEDRAHPDPNAYNSAAKRYIRLLSSQLDAIEFADSGDGEKSLRLLKRPLKRVPYNIPVEDCNFLSLLVQLSPERMSAIGQLDSLSACLQPRSLAGCLQLIEDLCRRFAQLPFPPPPPPQAQGRVTMASPSSVATKPPSANLELRLNDARLELASGDDRFICTCRLTQFDISASNSYDSAAIPSGYRLRRQLELSCTGLEVDAGRSSYLGNASLRQLYPKPLLADLPDKAVAYLQLVSWPECPSRLEIDCRLYKLQLVLLPQLLGALKEFSRSIQDPLVQLQTRLNWQAGDVLESAASELRQAGGVQARAEIMAPRLILPLTNNSGDAAVCVDLGMLTMRSASEGDNMNFNEFIRSCPAFAGLFSSSSSTSASSNLPADLLELRLEGLSATVCRLVSGSRTGDLVVVPTTAGESANFLRVLRLDGESVGQQPVLTAKLARRRCSSSNGEGDVLDGEVSQQAWLAVAMETPGFRLRALRSDLRSLALLARVLSEPLGDLANGEGDTVDGSASATSTSTKVGWAYDLAARRCSVGLALRSQQPAAIWQLLLAGASIDAVESAGQCESEADERSRWSIFKRSSSIESSSVSQPRPEDLLLIRSQPRLLTINLAPSEFSLWPDELSILADYLKTVATQMHEASRNSVNHEHRHTSPSIPLSAVLSCLKLRIYEMTRNIQPAGCPSNDVNNISNSFLLNICGFSGSLRDAEISSLLLTYYGDKTALLGVEMEIIRSDGIRLSLPSSALSFDSQLSVSLTAPALTSAVAISNAWQPLLRRYSKMESNAGTATSVESSTNSLDGISVTCNKVRLALLGSSEANLLVCNTDKLAVQFESMSCRVDVTNPKASISLREGPHEPLLVLENPSPSDTVDAITAVQSEKAQLTLSADWSAGFSSANLALVCPLHRLCVAVSLASANAVLQLIGELRLAVVPGGDPKIVTNSVPRNETKNGPGNGAESGPGNATGSGPGNATGSGPGNATGSGPGTGSGTWRLRVELHSFSLLLRPSVGDVACQRCGEVACPYVANLSVESVGPVWLKSSATTTDDTGSRCRLRLLKPDAALAVESLHQSWLARQQGLMKSTSVTELDSDNFRVRFDASNTDGSLDNVRMTLIQPKHRRLHRRRLLGFCAELEVPNPGGDIELQLQLGRLQLDQPCRSVPDDSFSVPVSLRARPTADILTEGRLVGAEIKLKLAAANATQANGPASATDRQPPWHFRQLSLSLGRLDLVYDAVFVGRLMSILMPPSEAPSRGIRIDQLSLLRNLRFTAANLPLTNNGWRLLKATVPAGEAHGVDWPLADGDPADDPGRDGGSAAQRWAKHEAWRLIRHRPVMAVTLPLGCLLGPCFGRRVSHPMPLSAASQMSAAESTISQSASTRPHSVASPPSVINNGDFADGNHRLVGDMTASALLQKLGLCRQNEKPVAIERPKLLLTNYRLLELNEMDLHSIVREYRLFEDSGDAVSSVPAVGVKLTSDGFLLSPSGQAFTATEQFTGKLMELLLPESDTAL